LYFVGKTSLKRKGGIAVKKTSVGILVFLFVLSSFSLEVFGDSSDILRQGLLGAGAGAVGGAASGAKGRDVWKGALAGAGVNIVGGALLDSMSGEKVKKQENVDPAPRDAYSEGYTDGYNNGYKQGYVQGYKDGIRESQHGGSSL
jgi:hypothetical protein